MERVRLVRPSIEYKEKVIEFKNEFFESKETCIDGGELLDRYESFEEWLEYVTLISNEKTIPDGSVLTDTFLAIDSNDNIVGIIDYRHYLNDFFYRFGHTGYSVAPSKRRQGYATLMLSLIVSYAKGIGASELKLSAIRSNTASIKTIKNNGGVYQDSFDFYGSIADTYIISL